MPTVFEPSGHSTFTFSITSGIFSCLRKLLFLLPNRILDSHPNPPQGTTQAGERKVEIMEGYGDDYIPVLERQYPQDTFRSRVDYASNASKTKKRVLDYS